MTEQVSELQAKTVKATRNEIRGHDVIAFFLIRI